MEAFGNSSHVCPKSKKENIVKILKGKHGISEFTPQLEHWIKQRDFKLISHSSLGLKDVLSACKK